MLSQDEFAAWCHQLQLTEATSAVIAQIRGSPPTRRVQSRRGNVSGRYPSRKMGVTIQFESHRVELAAVYEMEHDDDVLEFYDQPPQLQLTYATVSGRPVRVWHTPDYFVLRRAGARWEEWKPAGELIRLADRSPQRYRRNAAGGWECPPGERAAAEHGLRYRLRSSAELDPVYQRNLRFLEDYLRADRPGVAAAVTRAVVALVAREPGLPLADLLDQVGQGGDASADDVYVLIASGQLAVDWRAVPLAEPERVRVFADHGLARAAGGLIGASSRLADGAPAGLLVAVGSPVVWDGRGWTIVNVGETTTVLLAATGTLVELPSDQFAALVHQGKLTGLADQVEPGLSAAVRAWLARASPAEYQEANRRYQVIAPSLRGQSMTTSEVPDRTRRRWLACYRAAERIHGCGYLGLLPRWHARGNRTRKLPESTLALLTEWIATDYETLKQKSQFAVYAALVRAGEARGIPVPSYQTFRREVERRPRYEQAVKRRGPRAAYPQEPFYWELTDATPRHGDRPFEIAHLDHTELDLELVCSRTGQPLGRPWTTFLVDAFSRRLLAVYLTYDSPSYRSCMMALRECVRRHGRLPQTVVVDGGPEFAGTYFEALLARYACTKKTRPATKPRFGSVCERLFGTTNTRFVHTLLGNTQLARDVRQLTPTVQPRAQACWTLGALFARLTEWAYEIYDTIEHPALGQSPRAAFAAGLARGGARPHRLIPYDEEFRLATLPTTPKGTAKVQPGLGVKVRSVWYWSETFRDPEVERSQVPVRYDPFDVGAVHAFVRGHWVSCLAEHYASFAGRSERELLLASAELRRRRQRHGQRVSVTARQLADFLASVEAEETVQAQHRRDQEAQVIRGRIAGDEAAAPKGASPLDAPGLEPATTAARPPAATVVSDRAALDVYEEYR